MLLKATENVSKRNVVELGAQDAAPLAACGLPGTVTSVGILKRKRSTSTTSTTPATPAAADSDVEEQQPLCDRRRLLQEVREQHSEKEALILPAKGIPVAEHQEAVAVAVARGLDREDEKWRRSLLLAFPLGSGKTRAALLGASVFVRAGRLDKHGRYERTVFVMAKLSTVSQWTSEWQQLVACLPDSERFQPPLLANVNYGRRVGNIVFGTPDQIRKNRAPPPNDNVMFCWDEAHEIHSESSVTAAPLLAYANACGYCMLITGTPIIHQPKDLNLVIPLLYRLLHITEDKRIPEDITLQPLKRQLTLRFRKSARRILCHSVDVSTLPGLCTEVRRVLVHSKDVEFAKAKTSDETKAKALAMFGGTKVTKAKMDKYYALQKSEDPFLVVSRQRANRNKLPALLRDIEGDAGRRIVVVSQFLGYGIRKLWDMVRQNPAFELVVRRKYNNLPVLVSGKRRQGVADANVPIQFAIWEDNQMAESLTAWFHTSGQETKKILLLGPRASTGISLKGTSTLHVVEPFWSPFLDSQAIGRVRRRDSHPPGSAVRLVRWLAVIPKLPDGSPSPLQSADERVLEVQNVKRAALAPVTSHLQKLGRRNLADLCRDTQETDVADSDDDLCGVGL